MYKLKNLISEPTNYIGPYVNDSWTNCLDLIVTYVFSYHVKTQLTNTNKKKNNKLNSYFKLYYRKFNYKSLKILDLLILLLQVYVTVFI